MAPFLGDVLNVCQKRPDLKDGINVSVRSSLLILRYHNFFDLWDIWFFV